MTYVNCTTLTVIPSFSKLFQHSLCFDPSFQQSCLAQQMSLLLGEESGMYYKERFYLKGKNNLDETKSNDLKSSPQHSSLNIHFTLKTRTSLFLEFLTIFCAAFPESIILDDAFSNILLFTSEFLYPTLCAAILSASRSGIEAHYL